MKTLALEKLDEIKETLPENFKEYIRTIDGGYIVTSFSPDSKREYKVILNHIDGFWEASCSCPGFSKKNGTAGLIKPCKHIVACLVVDPGFPPKLPGTTELEVTDNDIREVVLKFSKKKTYRASALPLIEACVASTAGGDIILNEDSKPARIGRAAHAICQDIIQDNLFKVPLVAPYALRYDIVGSEEDLRFLSIFALQAWHGSRQEPGLSKYFDNPECEQEMHHEMKDLILTGHPDIISRSDDRVFIIDWKTGYRTAGYLYRSQMLGYAFLAAAQDKSIKNVTVFLVFLRDRDYVTYNFSRDELREWMQSLTKNIWDGVTYSSGEHCKFCPRRLNCPARDTLLRTSIANFVAEPSLVDRETGKLIPADQLYNAYQQAKLVENAVKAFLGRLKAEVEEVGTLPIPGTDRMFALESRKGSTKIEPITAIPILKEYLDDDRFAQCVKIEKGKMETAIKDTVEVGSGAKTIRKVMDELDEAGAISRGAGFNKLVVKEMKDG